MTEWNENLTPWKSPKSSNQGGVAAIETYDRIQHVIWQNRTSPPTEYEDGLGDALELILAETHKLEDIVKGLNELGFRMPTGTLFTEQSLKEEFARLAI